MQLACSKIASACDCFGALRSERGTVVAIEVAIYRMGNGPGAKIPEKWERKWKIAPGLIFAIFSISAAIFWPFQAWGHFPLHFLSHFSGIFCSGPVSHSVNGHFNRNCRAHAFQKKYLSKQILVDVSDIFYFFLLGEGEGRVRGARGRGESVIIENPRRGGGGFPGWGGAEGPGGCLRRIREFLGGGGLIFIFGPKRPPKDFL